jgi:hypothetical protein
VSLRQSKSTVIRATLTTLTLVVALITVGLTAPADGLFTIRVQPVFLRLGVDLDLKVGSMHVHGSWSALPDGESTNPASQTF